MDDLFGHGFPDHEYISAELRRIHGGDRLCGGTCQTGQEPSHYIFDRGHHSPCAGRAALLYDELCSCKKLGAVCHVWAENPDHRHGSVRWDYDGILRIPIVKWPGIQPGQKEETDRQKRKQSRMTGVVFFLRKDLVTLVHESLSREMKRACPLSSPLR